MQRAGLQSVPSIATRLGLIDATRSSGTVPPDEAHSPQKKDTRKWEQQAPQFRHGLTSDMVDLSTQEGYAGERTGALF